MELGNGMFMVQKKPCERFHVRAISPRFRQNPVFGEGFFVLPGKFFYFSSMHTLRIFLTLALMLGATLGDKTDSAYPGWAVHDLSGKVYASNSTIRIEWLYFSLPKNSWNDYEWVQVVLGPEGTVIDKNHYVTD